MRVSSNGKLEGKNHKNVHFLKIKQERVISFSISFASSKHHVQIKDTISRKSTTFFFLSASKIIIGDYFNVLTFPAIIYSLKLQHANYMLTHYKLIK